MGACPPHTPAIEWVCHVNHFASSLNSRYHSVSLDSVDLFDTVVAGYNEVVMLKRKCASLELSVARVSIHPYLEEVTEAR